MGKKVKNHVKLVIQGFIGFGATTTSFSPVAKKEQGLLGESLVTAKAVAKATSMERAKATHPLGERAEVRIMTGIAF